MRFVGPCAFFEQFDVSSFKLKMCTVPFEKKNGPKTGVQRFYCCTS